MKVGHAPRESHPFGLEVFFQALLDLLKQRVRMLHDRVSIEFDIFSSHATSVIDRRRVRCLPGQISRKNLVCQRVSCDCCLPVRAIPGENSHDPFQTNRIQQLEKNRELSTSIWMRHCLSLSKASEVNFVRGKILEYNASDIAWRGVPVISIERSEANRIGNIAGRCRSRSQ